VVLCTVTVVRSWVVHEGPSLWTSKVACGATVSWEGAWCAVRRVEDCTDLARCCVHVCMLVCAQTGDHRM
jgi:hypothetical protein